MGDYTSLPRQRCLNCGHTLNAAGSFEHPQQPPPEPGSLMVCIVCGAVMMLADDMTLRGMTAQEMDEVTNSAETMDELARTVHRVHLVRATLN